MFVITRNEFKEMRDRPGKKCVHSMSINISVRPEKIWKERKKRTTKLQRK